MEDFKSAAFSLYTADFLSSGKVAAMDLAEVGAYFLLLCYDWQENGLPNDHTVLARWLRVTPARFTELWGVISPCFIEHDGKLYNPRLEEERIKQIAWREKSSRGGKKGARARWNRPPKPTDDLPAAVPTADAESCRRVVVEYQSLHPRRRVIGKSGLAVIGARLREKFTADELIEALKGNAADPWHKEKKKHELSYVLRNADKVNDFRDRYHQQQNPPIITGGELTPEQAARVFNR